MAHTLRMRVSDTRDIATFNLAEGEDLNDRVRREIQKAMEEGRLENSAMRPLLPPAAVFETNEGETRPASIAVYTAAGDPVTERDYTMEIDNNMHIVYLHQGDSKVPGGAFPDERYAAIFGAAWKAGLYD